MFWKTKIGILFFGVNAWIFYLFFSVGIYHGTINKHSRYIFIHITNKSYIKYINSASYASCIICTNSNIHISYLSQTSYINYINCISYKSYTSFFTIKLTCIIRRLTSNIKSTQDTLEIWDFVKPTVTITNFGQFKSEICSNCRDPRNYNTESKIFKCLLFYITMKKIKKTW